MTEEELGGEIKEGGRESVTKLKQRGSSGRGMSGHKPLRGEEREGGRGGREEGGEEGGEGEGGERGRGRGKQRE